MSKEVLYTRIGWSVSLSHAQVVFLEGRESCQNFVTQKLEEKGFRCRIDVENQVAHLQSESNVNPDTAAEELDKLIVVHTFTESQVNPLHAALLASKPDGEVLMSLDDAVIVKDEGALKLIGFTQSVDGLSLTVTQKVEEETESKSDRSETDTPTTMIIPMNEGKYSYLVKYKQEDLQSNGYVSIDLIDSATGSSRYAVQITGPVNSVMLCEARILRLLQSVIETKYVFGIRSGLTDDNLNIVVKDVSQQNSCIARIEISLDHVDWNVPEDAQRLTGTGEESFVSVVFNELQKYRADVVVNTLHRNLTLGVGKISSALLKSCGGEVQEELREKYPDGIENGGLAVSGSGRMRTCRQIYHGALAALQGLESEKLEICYQNMILLVYNCLQKASTSGHVTIALPALGTGALQYPAEDVAHLMFKAVRLFLTQCSYTSVEQIFFVLYPSAPRELKQVFFAYCVSQTVETTVLDGLCFEEELGPEVERPEVMFRVGDTLVKVLNADLTEACHKSCPQLMLWSQEDLQDSQLSSSSSGYLTDVSDLPTTQTAVERDTASSRTVIHSYIEAGSQKDLKRAVKKGLKRGKKENIHMLALSVLSNDRLAHDVTSTTGSVLRGVNDSKASVFVLAVFIADRDLFAAFVTAARGSGYTSLKPTRSQFISLVDKTWEDFSEIPIQGALSMIETGEKAVLTVTSDSEQTNLRVAREIQEIIRTGSNMASGGNTIPGRNTASKGNKTTRSNTFSTSSPDSTRTDSSSRTDPRRRSLRRRATITLRDLKRALTRK